MYRRGPSRATPANVKCQKCLKNGHYSYECKSNVQERPYVPRPSRTQQLLNPKLVPKLTEATPPELKQKQGVADQQLAKLKAERARTRDLEHTDEYLDEGAGSNRRHSVSSESVSTISTSGSPGPSHVVRQASRSPLSITSSQRSPENSVNAHFGRDTEHSRFPPRGGSRDGRRSRSPPHPAFADQPTTGRDDLSGYASLKDGPRTDREPSTSMSRSRSPKLRRRYRSRSPDRRGVRDEHGESREGQSRSWSRRDRQSEASKGPPPQRQQRERSLSPFSKRIALTKTME